MNLIVIILLVALILMFGLAEWQIISLKQAYGQFFDKSEPRNLQSRLNGYASDVKDALHKLDQLASFSARLHKDNLNAISKIGLVRFNPFGDTGGDQSFCLVMLDSHNSGFSVSSIHARTGTRFYAKQITQGKPSHPLSEEEQRAFEQAITNHQSHD